MVNFSEIKGQEHCKRGLEVAAVGRYNILLIGPSKSGKSMLMEAMRGIVQDISIIDNVFAPVENQSNRMFIASMWPCECGNFTDPKNDCRCTPEQIRKHLEGVDDYILEHTDIHIEVPKLKYLDINRKTENTQVILQRVMSVRNKQVEKMELDKEAEELLKLAILELGISAKSYDKILRVSETIAKIDNADIIQAHHISEAILYRSLDRNLWV